MNAMSTRHVACAVLLSGAALTTAWGCGGGGAAAPSAPIDMSNLAPAPDLTMFVKVEAASEEARPFVENVKTALTTTLSGAGYKLVDDEAASADVVARVVVNATKETSLFQVQVNGKEMASFEVALAASFVAAADAAVIDQTTTTFTGKDGNVEQRAIDRIVVHLGTTGKLGRHASDTKAKANKVEDDLWKAANVEGCRKPTSAKACDGVQAYIQKYPTGKYTAEARQAIQDGEVEVAKTKDDEAWAAAMVEQCKKPTKSYDCKGIEEYLGKYPTGAHAAEGKAALKSSEKSREALKKQEDAKQKAANRDECIKDCRRAYESYVAFEVLVARCVQTECQ